MMTFYVNVKKCYRRRFDTKGAEIMPDFGSKQKVNTGFLMSSYSKLHLFQLSFLFAIDQLDFGIHPLLI